MSSISQMRKVRRKEVSNLPQISQLEKEEQTFKTWLSDSKAGVLNHYVIEMPFPSICAKKKNHVKYNFNNNDLGLHNTLQLTQCFHILQSHPFLGDTEYNTDVCVKCGHLLGYPENATLQNFQRVPCTVPT